MTRALLLAALASFFVLPRPPWGSPHYGEFLIAAAAIHERRRLRELWNDLPPSAHLLVVLLSLATLVALALGATRPVAAALVLARTAEALLVYALARRASPGPLSPVLTAASTACAVVGLSDYLATPPPFVARAYEHWSWGEANHFAALLALSAVVLLRPRPAAVPLVLLALLAAGSRTALLAVAAGLAASGRRGLIALAAGAALALLLAPPAVFLRALGGVDAVATPGGFLPHPHAPRWQTWRAILPPTGAFEAVFGRGAGFFPHRLYEGEWVRLFVEGGLAASLAAFALWWNRFRSACGAASAVACAVRPMLFVLLYLALGMNVLLAGRIALGGALLLGLAETAEMR